MNYYVKWKGVESGPFSEEEIRGMFDTGKIGLLHEIRPESSDRWLAFDGRDFPAAQSEEPPLRKSAPDDLYYAAAVAGGAAFIPPLFLFTLAFAYYAYKKGNRRAAQFALVVGAVATVAGLSFFSAGYPAIAKSL